VENGNQPFFCGWKWTVEENGILFLEENGTALIYSLCKENLWITNTSGARGGGLVTCMGTIINVICVKKIGKEKKVVANSKT